MSNWIKTRALFIENDDISEIIGKEGELELSPYRFNLDEVYAYNTSNHDNMITVRFKTGNVIIVDIGLSEFDNIINTTENGFK